MMTALGLAKRELRKHIKDCLSRIPLEDVQSQSSEAIAKLLTLPKYQAAKRISVYLSMPGGEIQTQAVIHDAFKNGKEVYIPFTRKSSSPPPSSVMDMVQLHSLDDYATLQPDKWGIPTPSEDSVIGRRLAIPPGASRGQAKDGDYAGVDLIVVPGMAFDTALGRLGHGKGFYDYFFQRCKAHADAKGWDMPALVGLALKEQLLDSAVPMDESDWRLDMLITGDGALHVVAAT